MARKLTKIQQQQADKYRKAGITITDDLDVTGKPGFDGKLGVTFCEGKWQLCRVETMTMWNNGNPKDKTSWVFNRDQTLMLVIDKVIRLEELVKNLEYSVAVLDRRNGGPLD